MCLDPLVSNTCYSAPLCKIDSVLEVVLVQEYFDRFNGTGFSGTQPASL